MYQRFLNNNDYLSVITEDGLQQLSRHKDYTIAQAEEDAEMSIVEYLSDNYEIEKELLKGKMLREYNCMIAYPAGAHFYHDGEICEALRAISGAKAPSKKEYWKELDVYDDCKFKSAKPYLQLKNWSPGDVVTFAGLHYECLEYNGIDFNDIRIPGVNGWAMLDNVSEWLANYDYKEWDVVKFDNNFYALLNKEDIDLTVNPYESDNWGLIGDYDSSYKYELSETEFVVYEGSVFYPIIKPSADDLKEGYNFRHHDPRNSNIKKHMVRLALYELHKRISPNNVSSSRVADYEASLMWLRDANRCKINPQIPRKLDAENKPVTEYAIATYMRDYDPNKNPWQI